MKREGAWMSEEGNPEGETQEEVSWARKQQRTSGLNGRLGQVSHDGASHNGCFHNCESMT